MECVDFCIAERAYLSPLATATALIVAASVGGDAACDVLHTCARWSVVRFDLRTIHNLLSWNEESAPAHYYTDYIARSCELWHKWIPSMFGWCQKIVWTLT